MEGKLIGVYKITSPKGKVYIGRSVDIENRFRDYRSMNIKTKGQVRLWRSFLKYGVENHAFEIVEICDRLLLNVRERVFQEIYNVTKEEGLNCIMYKVAHLDAGISEETRNKLSLATSGKNNPRFGVKMLEETKRKISEAAKGRYTGDKNPMYGKKNAMLGRKHTKETLKKMSESHLKRVHHQERVVLDTATGVFYLRLKEVSEVYGCNKYTIANRLRGVLKNNTTLIYC